MKLEYKIAISVIAILVLALLAYQPVENTGKNTDFSKTETPGLQTRQYIEKQKPGKIKLADNPIKENTAERLPEGVNPVFSDKPEIQTAWIQRGKDILLKNIPGAESPEFRNTYFHRGFKGRPVTCGEVQLSSDGTTLAGFQRFIYVGLQSTHLEEDVVNFDILWSKMCEEILDEPDIKL